MYGRLDGSHFKTLPQCMGGWMILILKHYLNVWEGGWFSFFDYSARKIIHFHVSFSLFYSFIIQSHCIFSISGAAHNSLIMVIINIVFWLANDFSQGISQGMWLLIWEFVALECYFTSRSGIFVPVRIITTV